ncbi:MAG: bacillithiol biosynthesis cysteine-adding enzyme BshC [Paenibacillus sp.]|nr:bacillithiol biosynthesis cysteine-adding enzyme BshC [Paenibacillus sp.]
MKVERYRWETSQPITRDYIQRFEAVAGLYAYNPWDDSSEQRRAEWLDRASRPQADRDRLAAALRAYNENVGNTGLALDHIEALRDSRTLVVTGGQQAGLFTGPLLVLYKAITVITEARQAANQLGRTVVPLFWIAGEDHDFEEANHTYVLTDSLALQKIKINASSDVKTSVSRSEITGESWEEAVAQLEQTLLNSEFKPELVARIRDICISSNTLTEQFAKTLAWLFGEYGLILLDSDDPNIRALESAMFEQIATKQDELGASVMAGKSRLEALGYAAQVELSANQSHLFVFHEGERLLLQRNDDGTFSDRRRKVTLTVGQLTELAVQSPDKLSNNVVSRPLMQDYLLPVLTVVLGPSEIAYWGLLRGAFEQFGLQMPILVPRYEFTLLEGTVQKQMTKFALSFEDIICRLDEKQTSWLEAQGSLQVEQLFADAKAKFNDLYGPVVEAVSGINPGLRKLGETNKQKIVEQIDFLEARAAEAFRSQHESALRHWERIRMSVLPSGKPQERLYNVFQYWAKYGGGWLRELMEAPLARDGDHRIIYF